MKLKIPGLTFLIVPILMWLTIVYWNDIILYFSSLDTTDIITGILVFTALNIIGGLVISERIGDDEADTNFFIFMKKYVLLGAIIYYIYRLLKYINTKLTVEL